MSRSRAYSLSLRRAEKMIKTLISIRIRSLIGGRPDSKGKRGANRIVMALVALYLIGVTVFLCASLASAIAPGMISAGLDSSYLGLFMIASFSFVFIFGIFETKSELFDCKDNDLLLSMPIRPDDIVASRIATVMIYSYGEILLVMLPAIVVYGINGGSVRGIVGGLLSMILIPPLATSLSCGIGYILALLSKKVKRNTLVSVVLALLFIALYFFVYTRVVGGLDSIMNGNADTLDVPLLSVIGSIAMLDLVPFIIFDIVSLFAIYFAWMWLSTKYISIVTASRATVSRKYKAVRMNASSCMVALVKKEFARFFSSAVYIINCSLGVILAIGGGIFILMKEREIAYLADTLAFYFGISGEEMIAPIAIAATSLFAAMNTVSTPALSLEGKSFWIIKSMPVSARTVLVAKLLPHLILTTPSIVIGSLLVMRAVHAPVEFWAFFVITPIVMNLLVALSGAVIGALLPKLEFQNEVQPIKQSLAMIVTLMTNLLITAGAVMANVYCVSKDECMLGAMLTPVVALLLTVILFVILLGPCARKYEKLS